MDWDALTHRIQRLEEDNRALLSERTKYQNERDSFCDRLKAADIEIMNRTLEMWDAQKKCEMLQKELREQKAKNEELNLKLKAAAHSGTKPSKTHISTPKKASPPKLRLVSGGESKSSQTSSNDSPSLKRKYKADNGLTITLEDKPKKQKLTPPPETQMLPPTDEPMHAEKESQSQPRNETNTKEIQEGPPNIQSELEFWHSMIVYDDPEVDAPPIAGPSRLPASPQQLPSPTLTVTPPEVPSLSLPTPPEAEVPPLSLPTPPQVPPLNLPPPPEAPPPSLPTPPSPPPPTISIKQLKEEKIKTEGGWKIPRSKIENYLASSPPFVINPPPLSLLVARRALTEAYKLPGMGLLWTSKDGRHRFLTPTFAVNPEMPRVPGAPGLLLSCRNEMCTDDPWTLFVKNENSKLVRLNYAGEYLCKCIGEMTKEEFVAQDPDVKTTWGDKIRKAKLHTVYRELHARIKLRKTLGEEPTKEQIQAESELIKQKAYQITLSNDDVIGAFERGEEHISIVKVECVAYHHDRAEDYARAQRDWEAKERAVAFAKSNGTYQKPVKGNKKRKVDAQPEARQVEEPLADGSPPPAHRLKEVMREEGTWPADDSDLSDLDYV